MSIYINKLVSDLKQLNRYRETRKLKIRTKQRIGHAVIDRARAQLSFCYLFLFCFCFCFFIFLFLVLIEIFRF